MNSLKFLWEFRFRATYKWPMETCQLLVNYLLNKNIVEMTGQSPGKVLPQVTEALLLLLDGQEYVVACIRTTVLTDTVRASKDSLHV